jgi:hypothetical protein
VPLPHKQEEEWAELEECEQEKMMLSILEAFSVRQRSSSLSKGQAGGGRGKSVHWSPSV